MVVVFEMVLRNNNHVTTDRNLGHYYLCDMEDHNLALNHEKGENMKIFKYRIQWIMNSDLLYPIQMPKGAEILTTAFQDDLLVIWARVDESAKNEIRYIHVYGTGWEIDPNTVLKYIGTAFIHSAVFHVFEDRK